MPLFPTHAAPWLLLELKEKNSGNGFVGLGQRGKKIPEHWSHPIWRAPEGLWVSCADGPGGVLGGKIPNKCGICLELLTELSPFPLQGPPGKRGRSQLCLQGPPGMDGPKGEVVSVGMILPKIPDWGGMSLGSSRFHFSALWILHQEQIPNSRHWKRAVLPQNFCLELSPAWGKRFLWEKIQTLDQHILQAEQELINNQSRAISMQLTENSNKSFRSQSQFQIFWGHSLHPANPNVPRGF